MCQPSPRRGAPAARLRRTQYIPSHLIPSRPIPSCQVTIPSHTIPSHTIPSSVEGCRSLSWLGHTCIWVCQPSPRRGAPAARLRRAQYIPSHLIPSRPIPSCQVTIPYHTIPYHLIPSSVEGCRSSSWLGHTCIWVCQPSPRRGAPAARLRRAQYIPSHLIPSRPIPSCQVTIPYHTIPYHTIPSSVEGCRSSSWLGHTCTWLCQPSPRRGAPAARLRRAQYIPSHLIPSRPIPSCQVTIPSHTIPYHLIPSSVEVCRSSSWLGHTCIWVCQPSPRRGAPAARLRRARYIPSHLIPSRPIPSCQVTIPSHPIPSHLIPSSVEACRSLSWLEHTCTWLCQPSPRRGAPAARLRRAQYIPSHLIPSRPIPSCQVTIPSHTIPSHLIPSSVEGCRSSSWLGHTCTWLCQPSPRRGAPAARLRRAQYIPSHLIPSRPIPSCQVTIPSHTIPYHLIPSSVEGCRSSSWLGHTCTWLCQPSPRRGAPAARLRRAQYIPSHLIPSRPIPSCQVTIPSHTIPSHLIPSSVEGCRSSSWLRHTCIWVCQPSPRRGAPAARLRRTQYIPSHLIPSRPIPSCQVTIPYHTIPSHLIPSSVEGCRSSSWLGHTCTWVCQPSPRRGAPAARLRRAQYIPSHLIPSRPIPSCQVTIPSHPIPYHLIPSSVEGCRSLSWLGHTCILGVPALSQAWRSCGTAPARTIHPIPSHPVPSNPILSGHHPIPSIPSISSHLVWKGAAARHGWGTHVSGCASPLPGVALLRHGSGAHNTSHPISSRPVQSHPVRSPSHPIPYHPIPYHLVWKGAAARHGWGTHVPGCASPLPGVALLRHGSGAHNTSHPISSRPVQSHPVRSPSHTIPYHTISSHLVWKGAAARHGWGTHVSGCASPLPGVALLRHGSGAHNTSHHISSRPVQSHPVRSPSHPIPYHPISSHLVWKGAAARHGWGTHVPGCASPLPGVALLRHGSGAHNTSHPISSRPVQSHPVRSPSHPIPYHPISSHLVWKGAAARHGWGTHVSGCASRLPGVALLRHGSGAHNTSHPISSRPVQSHPVRSPYHTIPYHTIPYHLVWKGAAARHGWGTHVPGCASPLPGVALLRHGSGAHNTSHPISSRPVQSHPVRSPSHTIPYHTISSHLVWKCAAARHGWGTHVSGCASPLPGVALLRHGCGAHDTSHHISSRPVQSHPVRSPSHPIPYHPISSHLVWKRAAACHG